MKYPFFIKKLVRIIKLCQASRKYCRNLPGHFYSPIVNTDVVKQREALIWNNNPVQGINFYKDEQLRMLDKIREIYHDIKFPEKQKNGLRYYFDNDYFSYADAIVLYGMIRSFTPKNIIEIGSGFSSALMLDVKDEVELPTKFCFIEPYPKRLHSLLNKTDYKNVEVIENDAQKIPLSTFTRLKKGDILFVDSTHVSKTGSDVNYILFEILPILEEGVIIHFHDVFDKFEYPMEWVYQKRSWNEDYLLRSFLMHNSVYKIIFFNHYLQTNFSSLFSEMPLFNKSRGSSLWLEKQKMH